MDEKGDEVSMSGECTLKLPQRIGSRDDRIPVRAKKHLEIRWDNYVSKRSLGTRGALESGENLLSGAGILCIRCGSEPDADPDSFQRLATGIDDPGYSSNEALLSDPR